MKWVVLAPYIKKKNIHPSSLWGECEKKGDIEIILLPAHYNHNRSRKVAGIRDWLDFLLHAIKGVFLAKKLNAGVITCFPQLAVLVGLLKLLSFSRFPIVAWTFNLGKLHEGFKQSLARIATSQIDKIIVHSSYELTNYVKYLNITPEKIQFVHLHRPLLYRTYSINDKEPFILAMGSANRDYKTLVNAVVHLGLKLKIVAPKRCLSGINLNYDNIEVIHQASLSQCRKWAQQAIINVTPISNNETASGQVSVIEGLMFGCAIITTDSIGTKDYVKHNSTGVMVEPNSESSLVHAINLLIDNPSLREELSINAAIFAKEKLLTEKAGETLAEILLEFDYD
jgi:glycosyltransferase involved in cell wall biosynthesis